jgi:molybdopterin/thiamine biosynthesis adenylyltransferase
MGADRAFLRAKIDELACQMGEDRTIGLRQVHGLADAFGSVRDVELAALDMGVIPERYLRNLGTIGTQGQARLLRGTVAIVGLGGLGGYVAEALCRMGIGCLILVDGDAFQEHNLNRQLLSSEGNLGTEKTRAARQRLASVNSAVETVCHADMLTSANLPQLIGEADVVVDALDRLPSRLMLQEGAQELGIPMVHGSIAGFLGQVTTIFPRDRGLRALYGEGDPVPDQGLELELGTPAATPMTVAGWEAQEVVKILTGQGQPLRNRLLIIDMASATCQVLGLG